LRRDNEGLGRLNYVYCRFHNVAVSFVVVSVWMMGSPARENVFKDLIHLAAERSKKTLWIELFPCHDCVLSSD
jgi:hypothetical protein